MRKKVIILIQVLFQYHHFIFIFICNFIFSLEKLKIHVITGYKRKKKKKTRQKSKKNLKKDKIRTFCMRLLRTSRTYCRHCSYVPARGKDPLSSVRNRHSKSKVQRERLNISFLICFLEEKKRGWIGFN